MSDFVTCAGHSHVPFLSFAYVLYKKYHVFTYVLHKKRKIFAYVLEKSYLCSILFITKEVAEELMYRIL